MVLRIANDRRECPMGAIAAAVPLMRGGRLFVEPCRDADFGVADVLMLLDVNDPNPTYCRHFLERVAAA
jgi:putative hemolysin